MRWLWLVVVALLGCAVGPVYSADFARPRILAGNSAGPCTGESCSLPTCSAPNCAAPTCSAPSCATPSCVETTCGEPTCGEPSCGEPSCGGCGFDGCKHCGGPGYRFRQLLQRDWFGGSVCGSNCGSNCGCDDGSNRLRIRGWLDAGNIMNVDSPTSHYNGPYNAVDRSNRLMFNQAYFILEKGLPQCGAGLGGRVDVLYGEDYFLAQSIGMELRPDGSNHWNPASQTLGLAIPQAYAELGSQRLNVKVGHFYSIVGYEGLTAPTNFFYSKSYSYQFAGPFTHWGSLATFRPSDKLQLQAAITNGWNGLDRTSDRPGMLLGAKYTGESWWTSAAVTTGQDFNNVAGLPGVTGMLTNRTRYSYLLGFDLTCRLSYVFHHWLGVQSDALADRSRAQWYGIDQYLKYTINDRWAAGMRFEWFRDDDGTRIGLNRAANPNKAPYVGSAYSLTAGVNWTPTKQVIVRPEIRSDWFNGQNGRDPYRDGASNHQLMLGMDAIYQF